MIGDCHTAALISRGGSIDWCCLPRFDSASSFGRLIDPDGAGAFELAPEGEAESSRHYLEDTLVLVTRWNVGGAEAEVIDLLVTGDHRDSAAETNRERQLIRVVQGHRGEIDFRARIMPRFDYGEVQPWISQEGPDRWSMIAGDDGLIASSDVGLKTGGDRDLLEATFSVRADERVRFSLVFRRPEQIDHDAEIPDQPDRVDRAVENTIAGWQNWSRRIDCDSAEAAGVRRSATVLRALTYAPTGAIVAAPTTSLPESIGDNRNWDYRYSWIRDSSFATRTLAEIGAEPEADAFRRFIERSAAGRAEDLQVLYGVGGERRLIEYDLDDLGGYRDSTPVRIGNAASGQLQLDAIGEVVNLSWRWHRRGHSPDDDFWRFLISLVETAAERWSEPDQGIWEWRGDPEHFVHSKVLCWSALDRGVRLAEECLREAPVKRWKKARDEAREAIETAGYDRDRGVFTQTFEHPDLDAALLLLPSVQFVDWDDERMIRTADAIEEELGAGNGLYYRYRRKDGLKGSEGAFIACSFWMVECLARQDRTDRAREVFDAALGTGNELGLFAEQWDPEQGEMLGNFPQGLSHLAHIGAALALRDTERRRES